MLSRDYRQMEPEQRRAIERKLGKRFFKPLVQVRKAGDAAGLLFVLAGFAVLGWLAGVLVLTLLYLISLIMPDAAALAAVTQPANVRLMMIISAVSGALGMPMWLLSRQRKAESGRSAGLQADLADGRVEIVTVHATGATRGEPMEYLGEEPPAFFIQVGPTEVLFLQGDYLDQALHAKTFPNSEFEVIRGAKSGAGLELRCHGKPMPLAEHDYTDITEEEFYFPRDGEVLSATLETIPASLRQLKKG